MSAIINNSGINYLGNDSLAGATSASYTLLMGWFKRRGAASLGSAQKVAQIGFAGSNPSLGLQYNATPNWTATYNGGGAGGSAACAADTWQHVAALYGPWDGTSRPFGFWVDGSNLTAGNGSSNLTETFSRIRLGRNIGATAQADGRWGQWALFTSPSNAAAIIAAAQTLDVNSLPETPLYAWPLLDNGNSSIGSANLATTGTVTWDAGDNPPVGAAAPAVRRRAVVVF